MAEFSTADLTAYLDEALPVAEMAAVEDALRHDAALAAELASLIAQRDAGVHSLGEIWRRNRLSCPPREQLGSYLLEALADDVAAFITFHLEVTGCRYCQANLADLRAQHTAATTAATDTATRRRKYFQSSAGHLRGKRN